MDGLFRLLHASRRIAWITLVVTLMGVSAPVVSRSLAWRHAAARAGRTEVCSGQGVRGPALSAATATQAVSGDAPAPVFQMDHCPFCLLNANWPGPPSAVFFHFFAESGLAPPVEQALFPRPVASITALPRGPPGFA